MAHVDSPLHDLVNVPNRGDADLDRPSWVRAHLGTVVLFVATLLTAFAILVLVHSP